jgi:HAD superfamily phosphoserine phosphatase-like hydrolase
MRTAFCFDLDGTVTTTEVLPCIASEIGVSDEIATLTRATMDGHIAFEPSFRLRCLILGQVPIERVCKIVSDIPLDDSIVSFICEHKADSFLVTSHLATWVQPIAEKCGCEIYSSTGYFENGVLRLNRLLNKGDVVAELRTRGYKRIFAIGDGANDVPMLAEADIGIAFGAVHAPSPAAIAVSDYIIHEGAALCRMLRAL